MTGTIPEAEGFVQIGEVHGVFGVKGGLKIRSLSRPPDGIFEYKVWHLGKHGMDVEFSVKSYRAAGDNFIVQLAGVTNREQAEALVGMRLGVPAAQLPATEPGVYYWRDLIGLKVFNVDGIEFGAVIKLSETGSADVLVVDGDRQRFIPFVMARYVQSVDLSARKIIVDWHPDD